MFGEKIRRYRLLSKQSLQELADKVGMDASKLSRIENGNQSLNVETLIEIASALGISPIDLFDEKHLSESGQSFYEKYGMVESSYIRFILGQQDLLHKQLDRCFEDQKQLMQHVKNQDEMIRKLMSLLESLQKKRGGGGGG